MNLASLALLLRYIAFVILLALLVKLGASAPVLALAVLFVAATAVVDALNRRVDRAR
ncbi:hypothetical protein COJE103337_03945 [Corynebacterium jeikeium]|nr:hypothetical protein [Corynebacterium jeikeium]WCZ54147.1 hypothetical protein CJEIK_08260 [Corynebacterium jeikeium]SUY80547.1 Uncharacterised protein [Corynebacterium jeikeium]